MGPKCHYKCSNNLELKDTQRERDVKTEAEIGVTQVRNDDSNEKLNGGKEWNLP